MIAKKLWAVVLVAAAQTLVVAGCAQRIPPGGGDDSGLGAPVIVRSDAVGTAWVDPSDPPELAFPSDRALFERIVRGR